MVSAIGLNSLPSSPVSENNGKNTTMMIMMAKAIGLATSRAASSTTRVRLIGRPDSRACDSSRKAFSTITTAPSTIMPMPMARPASDIRLADMPKRCIMMNANNIASGKVTMTTMAERNSPRNRNRITATRIEPSIRALVEVFSALSTISVRSYTAFSSTPLGRAACAMASLSLTALTTVAAFSLMRDSAMPSTTSSPLRVTAPKRTAGASLTSATSRT